MKDGRFEIGDIIKGTQKANELYRITNIDMSLKVASAQEAQTQIGRAHV